MEQDSIWNALFLQVLCPAKEYKTDEDSVKKLALMKKGMFLNYQHHWIVDNMPVTWCYQVRLPYLISIMVAFVCSYLGSLWYI